MPKATTITIDNGEALDKLLTRLGAELGSLEARYELLVAGRAVRLAQGLSDRRAHEIDLVGLREHGRPVHALPLPGPLSKARCRMARDLGVTRAWLRNRHGYALHRSEYDGFVDRGSSHPYGPALTVHLAARVDEIVLAFAACVGSSPCEADDDLRALEPAGRELFAAGRRVLARDTWDADLRLAVLETLERHGADPGPGDLATTGAPPMDWW